MTPPRWRLAASFAVEALLAALVTPLALLVTPLARWQDRRVRKMNEKPNEPEGAEGGEE